MAKIIFGLNHRDTEAIITQRLGQGHEVLFAATYREAIMTTLEDKTPDVIVLRDSIKGDISFVKMAEQIRLEYSEVRIIFVCGKRKRGDMELAKLVGLGIYDIISKDTVPVDNIVSAIKRPQLFRDVAQFYLSDYVPDIEVPDEPEPQSEPAKKSGVLGGIKGLWGNKASGATAPVEETVSGASMDIALLRKSIQEEAVREAQRDVDSLIEKAVEAKMQSTTDEIERLNQVMDELNVKIKNKDAKIATLSAQMQDEQRKFGSLKDDYEEHVKQAQEGFNILEEQLSASTTEKNTPAWYAEQSARFAKREADLIGEIKRLQSESSALAATKEQLIEANKQAQEDNRTMTKQLSDAKQQLGEVNSALTDKVQALTSAKMEAEVNANEAKRSKERAKAMEEERDAYAPVVETVLSPETEEIIRSMKQENTELTMKLQQTEEELKEKLDDLDALLSGDPDYSMPSIKIPYLPDTSNYVKSTNPTKVVAVLGAKHGIGNTTIAINMAAHLAKAGRKVLLIEFNNCLPLTNGFFELMNIPLGLSDALSAVCTGENKVADASIIRFQTLKPVNKHLAKAYKKLPPGFHLLTYANKDLSSRYDLRKAPPTREALFALMQYLLSVQQYAHIVLDIQAGDQHVLDTLLDGGANVNKLVLTTSQDPHSLSILGANLHHFTRNASAGLLAHSEIVINKYSGSGHINEAKIAKYLHLPQKRLSFLTDDVAGYDNAAATGVPYLLAKGRFASQHEQLYAKIF